MQNIFISQNDEAFNQFFKGINQYVAAKTAGAAPEWTHIPHDDRTYLTQIYIEWYSAYVLTTDPHHSQVTKETSRTRLIAERVLKNFVSRFLRSEPVTDLDRSSMGIPNYSQTGIAHIEASDVVELEFKLRNVHGMLLDLWKNGTVNKTKPQGLTPYPVRD